MIKQKLKTAKVQKLLNFSSEITMTKRIEAPDDNFLSYIQHDLYSNNLILEKSKKCNSEAGKWETKTININDFNNIMLELETTDVELVIDEKLNITHFKTVYCKNTGTGIWQKPDPLKVGYFHIDINITKEVSALKLFPFNKKPLKTNYATIKNNSYGTILYLLSKVDYIKETDLSLDHTDCPIHERSVIDLKDFLDFYYNGFKRDFKWHLSDLNDDQYELNYGGSSVLNNYKLIINK